MASPAMVRRTQLRVVSAAVFAVFQVGYVLWRVAPFPVPAIPESARGVWETYGVMTGANSGYSFFAPAVASQMVVTARWLDRAGKEHVEIHDGRADEGELRITAMILALQQLGVTDMSARAIATDTLSRHPEAQAVTLSVAMHIVPSMAEYREGARPDDRTFFRAIFARRADLAALGTVP